MSDDAIKDALRLIPYGFYSITSRNGDEVNAMVANWLTQVSFEPRQVALGLQKTSHSHSLITAGKVFAINIFYKADVESMKPFTKSRAKNPDKMINAQYTVGPETGCPILEGAAAYLECRVVGSLDSGGDHEIIVGEVIGAAVLKPGSAADAVTLVDLGWSYAG
jgi:flavin reductase (DIM6/NTAB) family NADH-FMN oxidoreductase RutF